VERLNESHKQALRYLVKAVREGELPQEFHIMWGLGTSGATVFRAGKQPLTSLPLTPLTLDILTDEGLLFSNVRQETTTSGTSSSFPTQTTREKGRTCFITPQGFRAVDSNFTPIMDTNVQQPPVEITKSLERFRSDFPDNTRLAFIMMQFGTSSTHEKILAAIKSALQAHNMVALRADERQYHDDLFYNILTYIYGTRFGIAVFERIEADTFNPNVSLEVGYMLGLGKSVCLLKERTLKMLNSDLVGKLYRPFDMQNPQKSIPPELFAWMDDKGFIVRHPPRA
jgi:hypothetical protein